MSRFDDQLTDPQRLRRELEGGEELSVRELSQRTSLSEGQVRSALEKLRLSCERGPLKLSQKPPRCLACGYAFESRRRLSRPSRCPQCRSERLSLALHRLAPG